MKKTMLIKEISSQQFINDYFVGFDSQWGNVLTASQAKEDCIAKNVVGAKQIYLKKECGINVGDRIKFEFKDFAQMTKSELLATFTYVAEKYDHLTLKFNLLESTIEPICTKQ